MSDDEQKCNHDCMGTPAFFMALGALIVVLVIQGCDLGPVKERVVVIEQMHGIGVPAVTAHPATHAEQPK